MHSETSNATAPPDDLERRLLNDFQRHLPLCPAPFAAMAQQLGVEEQAVLDTLARLCAAGAVSRIGPVIRPHTVGASTLAAMAVPPTRLESVAELVNGYEEVNHNYEREHRFNLWFVVTATDEAGVRRVLDDIEARAGLPVMELPMQTDFHIDLGFELKWT